MELTLIIITLVIASAALAVSIVLLVSVLKQKGSADGGKNSSDAIVALSTNLQSIHNDVISVKGDVTALQNSVPLVISDQLAQQMVKVQTQLGNQANQDNARIAEFQKNVNETLANSTALTNKALQDSIAAINKKVDDNFITINKQVNESLQTGFKSNSDTMGQLQKQLGEIGNAQKNLEGIQKDVMDLQTILKGNQSRGAFGELQLSVLLENTFPNGKGIYYNLQDDLGFTKDDEKTRPDADLIFSVNGVTSKLCIDSKFPFAEYAKLFSGEKMSDEDKAALKTRFHNEVRIKYKDIADKYIIEGVTMRYAVMFIPNDGIFAYVENEFPDLVSEARSLGVILACPSTLQAIIVVFHNAAVEAERSKNIEKINEALKGLSVEFDRFSKRWDEVQRSIQNAANKTVNLGTTVNKISSKFTKINKSEFASLAGDDDTPEQIEGPSDSEDK